MRGQVVAVLGASGVLGGACAETLAAQGATLILHGRRSPRTYDSKEPVTTVRGDLRRSSTRRLLVSAAMEYRRLNGLVVAVGRSAYGAFAGSDERTLKDVLNVNLTAPMMAVRSLLPFFVGRKSGSIVIVSSIWGHEPAAGEVAYAAAKAGLIHFARSLAAEMAPSSVRVNAVCPKAFESPMLAPLDEAARRDLARRGLSTDVATVAALCAALLDPDDTRTGQAIVV